MPVVIVKTPVSAGSPGKPAKYGKLKGNKISTYAVRIPFFLNKNLLHDLIFQILKPLAEKDPDRWFTLADLQSALCASPAPTPPGYIQITAEDLAASNNRALGFIAYKFKVQPKPTEVKSSDRDSIIAQITELL